MEKLKIIVAVVKLLYKNILRAELVKLVDKSESPIDNMIIGILDKLLLE